MKVGDRIAIHLHIYGEDIYAWDVVAGIVPGGRIRTQAGREFRPDGAGLGEEGPYGGWRVVTPTPEVLGRIERGRQ